MEKQSDLDMEKLTYCDADIIERLYKECEPTPAGTFEDYQKLPLPEAYLKRLAAEKKTKEELPAIK